MYTHWESPPGEWVGGRRPLILTLCRLEFRSTDVVKLLGTALDKRNQLLMMFLQEVRNAIGCFSGGSAVLY
jgi:hypothetical protein